VLRRLKLAPLQRSWPLRGELKLNQLFHSLFRTKTANSKTLANDLRFTVINEDEIKTQLQVDWEGLVLVGLYAIFFLIPKVEREVEPFLLSFQNERRRL
jgi:hypothetical protein